MAGGGGGGAIVEIPVISATVAIETLTAAGAAQKRETLKNAEISLVRNEFREVFLRVEHERSSRKVKLTHDRLEIHRKFVKDGKATLSVLDSSPPLRLLISNGPPHALTLFLKGLAAKLAERATPLTSRQKLRSDVPRAIEDISPLTAKDAANLRSAESGPTGLLKLALSRAASASTPTRPTAGRGVKRKRIGGAAGKENAEPATTTPSKTTPRRPALARKATPKRVASSQLTQEQQTVLQSVKSGRNVFFTGGAGVGKSFLIKKIIGMLPPDATFVTASTGVAAYQICGITLHAFAGIGNGEQPVQRCIELASRKGVQAQWKRCKHLIVDEVSMVDGKFFEKLEAVARAVRGSDRPFGGIQLILTGDFLQLPPVTKGSAVRTFCFETSAWRRCGNDTIELTQVKRQNDARFIAILRALRLGRCDEETAEVLRATKSSRAWEDGIVATRLCTHTADADRINAAQLAGLAAAEARVFAAVDSDPAQAQHLDRQTPVLAKLTLKTGAQVMLMKNLNIAAGLVNGARGRVEAFAKSSGNPVVRFACGVTEEVKPERWAVKAAAGGGGAVAARRQLPLRLAWAFSVHKSQGMTLDRVEVGLGRVFECGQAYVALSRAKDLGSVRVLDFDRACIRADPKVLAFYRQLKSAQVTAATTSPSDEQF